MKWSTENMFLQLLCNEKNVCSCFLKFLTVFPFLPSPPEVPIACRLGNHHLLLRVTLFFPDFDAFAIQGLCFSMPLAEKAAVA